MVAFTEGQLTNARGQVLYTVQYVPDEGAPLKAALVWHHGLGEHVGRYKTVFSQLADAGIAVFSFDAHGHGKSGPKERVFIKRFSDMVDDLYIYLEDIRRSRPSLPPLFVGGQSLGGLVAAHAVLRNPSHWNGLLLHSAALDVEWTTVLKLQAKVGNLMAALAPKARLVPAVRPQDMSVDPAVVADYVADPLNVTGNVRARTGNEVLKAFRALSKRGGEISIPIYAAHGSADRCTSYPAVKRFLAQAKSEDKTLKEFPGAYHELLMGPERQEAVTSLVAWITGHAGAQARL